MYYAEKQTLCNSRACETKKGKFIVIRWGLKVCVLTFLWSLPWRTNNSCSFICRKLTWLLGSRGCDLSFQKRNVTAPCQALADLEAFRGWGGVGGRKNQRWLKSSRAVPPWDALQNSQRRQKSHFRKWNQPVRSFSFQASLGTYWIHAGPDIASNAESPFITSGWGKTQYSFLSCPQS